MTALTRRSMRAIACAIAPCAAAIAAVPAAAAESRCGIFTNPTPGNFWLRDAAGEWTIGVQMGYQAEGIETIPECFYERGWVRTNGYYGHRCACLSVDSDRKSMRIRQIYSARPLPMKRCDGDPALRRR